MISSWAQERYNNRFRLISANTTNSTLFKAGVVKLGRYHLSNNGTTIAYLKIYDKATAPTVGTDIPIITIGIPSGATYNGSSVVSGGGWCSGHLGLPILLGLGIGITSVASDADTTAVALNQVTVLLTAE